MAIQSARFTLNKADWLRWGKNALVFLAPALVVLLGSVKDLIPKDASYGVILLYVVNLVVDLIRKFVKGR